MGLLPQRPLFRRLLVALTIVSLLLFGLSCWLIGSKNSLNRRIDAIRAEGYPATIADLAPAIIPADDDAAAQLAAAAKRFDEFSKEHGRFYKTPEGLAYESQRQGGEGASAEQLASIQAIVEKYPDLDDALRRAAACNRYASRLDFKLPQPQFQQAMIDQSSDIRTMARFVQWQMELSVAEGRPDVAVEQGIRLLRLAGLFETAEPCLVNSMVAMAVRQGAAEAIYSAITSEAQDSISSELRKQLDQELANFRAADVLRHAIITERACVISIIQTDLAGMNPIVANTVALPMKAMYVEAIDVIESILRLTAKAWHETFAPGRQNVFQTTRRMGAMARNVAPSFKPHFDAVYRTSATLRSLRAVNALQHYAVEHGKEAAGLSDLNLPADSTADPFNGQQLIVKQTNGGWLVYSVGTNGVDDGGNFDKHQDDGVGPPREKSAAVEGE